MLLRFLVGLLALTGLGQRAFACTCAPPESPTDELERSTAVFAGKVAALEARSGLVTSSADPVRVTFRGYTVWKGPQHDMLTLTTARSSISCGYEFEAGREYLVYAYGEENDLQVSLCSRTRPLTLAAVDLIALGRGRGQAGGVLQTYKYVTMVAVVTAAGTAVGVKWLLAQRKASRSRPC